jgi:hypothetical protein
VSANDALELAEWEARPERAVVPHPGRCALITGKLQASWNPDLHVGLELKVHRYDGANTHMLIGGGLSEPLNRVLFRCRLGPQQRLVATIGESLELIYDGILHEPLPAKLTSAAFLIRDRKRPRHRTGSAACLERFTVLKARCRGKDVVPGSDDHWQVE